MQSPNTGVGRALCPEGRIHDPEPLFIEIAKPTNCCGRTRLANCEGQWRCPCGRKQNRAANALLRRRIVVTGSYAAAGAQGEERLARKTDR